MLWSEAELSTCLVCFCFFLNRACESYCLLWTMYTGVWCASAPCRVLPNPRTVLWSALCASSCSLSFGSSHRDLLSSPSVPIPSYISISHLPGGWGCWCVGICKGLGLLKTNLSGAWRHMELQHKYWPLFYFILKGPVSTSWLPQILQILSVWSGCPFLAVSLAWKDL